jgi:enediyne biosynthesis protein E2
MWWVYGADPESIARAISRFPSHRRAEMWTGIGTAVAYAGAGVAENAVQLCALAGAYRLDLLSGIPFAAHMRHKGGNTAEWTERVCSELLHLSVSETSSLIAAELNHYLSSWQGTEAEKWNSCYMVLRDRVKHLLAEGRCESPNSVASGKTGV